MKAAAECRATKPRQNAEFSGRYKSEIKTR